MLEPKTAAGWVNVAVCTEEQPLLSETVTVYVPAGKPEIVAVVFAGDVFHK